jgi:hypothetical protein
MIHLPAAAMNYVYESTDPHPVFARFFLIRRTPMAARPTDR